MSLDIYGRTSRQDKAMTEQQFEDVVEAILAGKYSWACVLVLRAAGYNPLHYIPYRTYNRLIKDNCLAQRSKNGQEKSARSRETPTTRTREGSQHLSGKIRDLGYLENVNKNGLKMKGGHLPPSYFCYM